MQENVLGQWIQALRSGDYQQCQGSLYLDSFAQDEYRYCCLGVLSAITNTRDEYGTLLYPVQYALSIPGEDIPLSIADEETLILLNDVGSPDRYHRALWLLESAPELFITS